MEVVVTIWGYARVSTAMQDVDGQVQALRAAGVEDEHLVVEHISGTKSSRPGLDGLLGQLQSGDSLVVWKLDRLGRSLSHLVAVADDLRVRGVELRSLTEGMDTATPAGRMLFGVVAAMAQFERDLVVERTAAGLAAARARGATLGRPSRVTPEQVRMIHRLAAEHRSQRTIAATVGVPRSTVGRILRDEVPSLRKHAVDPADLGELL